MKTRLVLTQLACAAGGGLLALPAAAQTALAQLPPVEVVGVAPLPGLRFFARVNNLFDRRYATAAQLGNTGFDANGHFRARLFPAHADGDYPLRGSTSLAPGALPSVSVGLRYTFN